MKYTKQQLAEFWEELKPYMAAKNSGKLLTQEGQLRYLRDRGVVRLHGDTFSVICEVVDGKTDCSRFAKEVEKLSAVFAWRAPIDYARRKELEELDEKLDSTLKGVS